MWNLAQPRGTWFAWPCKISCLSVHEGGNAAPNWQKFPLFGRVPRRGEPFDRFLQLLGAFIRPTTVHYCFTFEVIRFTGYGVIAEKPHISHLPGNFLCTLLYQKMIGTFLMVSTSSITMQSLGKMVLRVLAVSAKMYCLFSIFCHTLEFGVQCVWGVHSSNKHCITVYASLSMWISAFSQEVALSDALHSFYFRC